MKNKTVEELAEIWYYETWMHSFPSTILTGEAYEELITRGQEAIEFLVQKLKNGDHGINWMWALEKITGEHPYKDHTIESEDGFAKADVDLMAEDWLDWHTKKEEQDGA